MTLHAGLRHCTSSRLSGLVCYCSESEYNHPYRLPLLERIRCCFQILECVTKSNETLDEFLRSYVPNPRKYTVRGMLARPDDLDFWMSILAKLVCKLSKFFQCVDLRCMLQYEAQDPELYATLERRWDEWFRYGSRSREAQQNSYAAQKHILQQVCHHFLYALLLKMPVLIQYPCTYLPHRSPPRSWFSGHPLLHLVVSPKFSGGKENDLAQ